MKKFTILLLSFCVVSAAFAQVKPASFKVRNEHRALLQKSTPKDFNGIGAQQVNPIVSNKAVTVDPTLMMTKYDLQTNSANQNRIYKYADGTIGATANMSHLDAFGDRGTGYNYYNGTSWETQPTARIESSKAGWPSYAPWGANGEIVVTHHNTAGLFICTRPQKGTGAWTETILAGPAGAVDISWPRVITNGPDNMYVHIICVTYTAYQGLDLAMLYYRSLDGGQTWETQHRILDGMTSAEYLGFSGDTYSWAEPMGDTIAFTFGDSWNDQALMKSTNNGDDWTKTIIWNCPFNLWNGGDTTGHFYASDGAHSIALDKNGKAHVVFGLQNASGDETGAKFWTINQDGLVYWNENMPELPQDLDPDTLFAHGNLIGWCQDTIVLYNPIADFAYYYLSMSSMPYIVVDDDDKVFVIFSSITNLRDGDNFMLRHIFARASNNLGAYWHDKFVDLTADFAYNWSECVYPSASPTSDTRLYLEFQSDLMAGVFLKAPQAQGQQVISNNDIIYMSPLKDDIVITGVNEVKDTPSFYVSQNIPNPVHGITHINVQTERNANVKVEVYSLVGQRVMEINKGYMNAGSFQVFIDASQLPSGVYFYTVTAGTDKVTRKMIVE